MFWKGFFLSHGRGAVSGDRRVSRLRWRARNTCLNFEHFGNSGSFVGKTKYRTFRFHTESPKTNSCRCRYNRWVWPRPGRLHCTLYTASSRGKILLSTVPWTSRVCLPTPGSRASESRALGSAIASNTFRRACSAGTVSIVCEWR